jgi:streptogramin lyase
MLHIDPASERFDDITLPRVDAAIRQMRRRRDEVRLLESGSEHLSGNAE